LDPADLEQVIDRALDDAERGLGGVGIAPEARTLLAAAADGDARRALNLLELAADLAADAGGAEPAGIDPDTVRQVIEGSFRRFDKGGEAFYDQISALHKSVRGSAPDAALYWLARMIDGGCDPLYIARRVVRMASEDIGNADPRALDIALAAWDAQHRLGSPEGELALAQAVVFLACAAKSNAVYTAWNAALEDARRHGSLEVPVHLRNAPTQLMKGLGYGRDYRYAHDEPEAYAAGERYFPDGLEPRRYYRPVDRGLEIRIREKLAHLAELDRTAAKKAAS
jgi:putative ATPase